MPAPDLSRLQLARGRRGRARLVQNAGKPMVGFLHVIVSRVTPQPGKLEIHLFYLGVILDRRVQNGLGREGRVPVNQAVAHVPIGRDRRGGMQVGHRAHQLDLLRQRLSRAGNVGGPVHARVVRTGTIMVYGVVIPAIFREIAVFGLG